jgi:hypothetical protein
MRSSDLKKMPLPSHQDQGRSRVPARDTLRWTATAANNERTKRARRQCLAKPPKYQWGARLVPSLHMMVSLSKAPAGCITRRLQVSGAASGRSAWKKNNGNNALSIVPISTHWQISNSLANENVWLLPMHPGSNVLLPSLSADRPFFKKKSYNPLVDKHSIH